MALTKKEVEEEYMQKLYRTLKGCEEVIDKKLVDDFGRIFEEEKIDITLSKICRGRDLPSINIQPLVTLIKDKYSEWQVSYNETDKTFTFKYDTNQRSLLNLFGSLEGRFSKLDIDDDDEDDDEDEVIGHVYREENDCDCDF